MKADQPMSGEKRRDDREDRTSFSVVDRRPGFEAGAASPPEEPRYPSVVEELKARAEEAERRAREISTAYRRIDEERDAFRERLSRDLERRVDIARAELMRRLIPVLDDLDRALAAARASSGGGSLLAGVSLVRDRLRQTLAAEGVEEIETKGLPFDPSVAEAVATVAVDDPAQDGLVLEEMEKGYRLRGALLRPARVQVGRLTPQSR
jgi:molecular chaperone GrpE